MADRKITDLTALAAGSQATGDLLTIVDVSEAAATDKNKKITVESLFKGIPGNVGIGTSSPQRALVVSDAGAEGFEFFPGSSDTGNTLNHYDRGSSAFIDITTNADKHIFGRADGEKMRIDSSGNIGIGTTSPSNMLHINGASPTIRLSDTGANGSAFSMIEDNNGLFKIRNDAGNSGTGSGIAFEVDASERMRINSSGNVGIGESSPDTKLHVTNNVNNSSTLGSNAAATLLVENSSASGFANIKLANASNANNHAFVYGTTTSGSLRIMNNTAERMRIDSSGNVGIGTTLPSTKLHIHDGTGSSAQVVKIDSGGVGLLSIQSGTTTDSRIEFGDSSNDDAGYIYYENDNDVMRFGVNASERMRITSDGNVFIGDSSPTLTGRLSLARSGFVQYNRCTGTGTGNIPLILERASDNGVEIEFKRAGSVVGNINVTSTTTNYVTSSDYRLKENVVNLDGAITRVKQLAPKRFNFIADADTTVDGFLAHEAATVVPEAVTGTHNEVDDDGNAVMQGIDQSKLVPLLTAALQEAIAEIETLKTKVAALEAG